MGRRGGSCSFQHERDAGKPILDNKGRLVSRGGILVDGTNCDPFSFPTEGVELNRHWGVELQYILDRGGEEKEARLESRNLL